MMLFGRGGSSGKAQEDVGCAASTGGCDWTNPKGRTRGENPQNSYVPSYSGTSAWTSAIARAGRSWRV